MHAIMDYVIGLVLLVAPNIFGFNGMGAPASVARWVGILILAQAVMTRWPLGLVRVIPVRMHLMMDYVIGAVLAASPWIWGFNDNTANVWAPHLIVGLLIIGQAAITRAPREDASVTDFDRDRRDTNSRRAA